MTTNEPGSRDHPEADLPPTSRTPLDLSFARVSAHAADPAGRPLAAVMVRYDGRPGPDGEPPEHGPYLVLQPQAGASGTRALRLPAVDQVVVVARVGAGDAVVLGAVYPDTAELPADDVRPESHATAYPDGTRVEYHPERGVAVDTPLPVYAASERGVFLGVRPGEEGGTQPVALHDVLLERIVSIESALNQHAALTQPGAHPQPTPPILPPRPDFRSRHTHST